jgi:hypothetical protein
LIIAAAGVSSPRDAAGKPRELVTREELCEKLWGQTVVDFDHSLNKAVNKIREALGDSAENPRFHTSPSPTMNWGRPWSRSAGTTKPSRNSGEPSSFPAGIRHSNPTSPMRMPFQDGRKKQ